MSRFSYKTFFPFRILQCVTKNGVRLSSHGLTDKNDNACTLCSRHITRLMRQIVIHLYPFFKLPGIFSSTSLKNFPSLLIIT